MKSTRTLQNLFILVFLTLKLIYFTGSGFLGRGPWREEIRGNNFLDPYVTPTTIQGDFPGTLFGGWLGDVFSHYGGLQARPWGAVLSLALGVLLSAALFSIDMRLLLDKKVAPLRGWKFHRISMAFSYNFYRILMNFL